MATTTLHGVVGTASRHDRGRVAIIHERFTEVGGSEKVVEQLLVLWPDATVYTTVVDRSSLSETLAGADIRPSPLQPLYRGGRSYAHLLPLLPWAMSHIDVGDVDLVVASHHAFANRVHVPRGSLFISYTHTPARWMWDKKLRALESGTGGRVALGAFAAACRRSDRAAAQRPDEIVVNSAHVAERVRRWWGRDAEVVHPPVDTERFVPEPTAKRGDFFLLAGRLVPYKRPEIAVAAARRAGVELVVAGEGRSRNEVERVAGPGVELLGAVDDDTLVQLYRTCSALVFPGEEDFGIVPVEAQACGTPVIAVAAGGARESVIDGVTGALYETGGDDVSTLARTLSSFDPARYDPVAIRSHAEKFSQKAFRENMERLSQRVLRSRPVRAS